MKTLHTLCALLLTTLVFGQGKYEQGMQKAFDYWQQNLPLEASALFERIALAEQDNWLPPYYAANTLIVAAFTTEDASQTNEMLEKAKSFIATAQERSPDNAEVITMEGLLYTGYVAMAPETYGMKYSPKIMALHGKALELDPTNPRAQLNSIEYEIGSARFFGTDLKTFCDRLEAVRPAFDKVKSDVPFYPKYGAERIDEIKQQCGCE